MECKMIVVSVVIIFSLSVVSAEHCESTDILCYSSEKYNRFKIYITINNTLKDNETRTLSYFKDLLQEIPSVKCIVQGCDEEFNNLFQSALGSNAKVHINEKERNLSNAAPKVTPVFQYQDMVTLNKDDSSMESKKNNSTFLDEIDSDIEETKSEIEVVNNYIDENDHQDHKDDEYGADAPNVPGYPIKFTLFPGNASYHENIRVKRASKACGLGNLQNSYIKCEVWPDLYMCKQKCIFGHGLETSRGTVVKKSHKCRISQNRWKPEKIKDCKPYMNCKVSLKQDQEGSLHCKQRDHFEPPYCKIKCGSKKPQRHECSHQMANDLPECASLSGNVMTIDRPMSVK